MEQVLDNPAVKVSDVKGVKKEISLAQFSIQRKAGGIELFCKSQFFEDHFKEVSGGATNFVSSSCPYKGFNVYDLQTDGYQNEYGFLRGQQLYFDSNRPSFNFLRTVGVGEGITLKFPNVMSKEAREKYISDFQKYVNTVYRDFLKPFKYSCEITVNQVTFE